MPYRLFENCRNLSRRGVSGAVSFTQVRRLISLTVVSAVGVIGSADNQVGLAQTERLLVMGIVDQHEAPTAAALKL